MLVSGHLSGGAGLLKKYQVGATVSRTGIPLNLAPAAGGLGLALGTTTGAVDMVGLAEDTATYVTAQQTGNADVERLVTVNIRPDAIIKARLSGGAAAGTALTLYPVTTASTDGLAVTTASAWDSPTYDEGATWGYDGANAGQIRRIGSVSSTAATLIVALNNDTVVGDNFLRAPFWPMFLGTPTLCTELTEVRADVAVATNTAEFQIIEIFGLAISEDGRNKSYVLMVPKDHILNTVAV